MQFMMENNKGLVYESPDGGKTIYARKRGSTSRHLFYEDPAFKKERELNERWIKLKEIVFMANDDPSLNDALNTLEILYALKKNEQ